MKLTTEIVQDTFIVSDEDGDLRVVIDLETGVIEEIHLIDASIHVLASFITKAKAKYNRTISRRDIQDLF